MTTPYREQALGGWITHDGGENPVPGQMVECRYSDGQESHWPVMSDKLNASWGYVASYRVIDYRAANLPPHPTPPAPMGRLTNERPDPSRQNSRVRKSSCTPHKVLGHPKARWPHERCHKPYRQQQRYSANVTRQHSFCGQRRSEKTDR